MLAPELTVHDHPGRDRQPTATVRVSGPLATADHVLALLATCRTITDGQASGLVINVSGVTVLTETGVRGLRELARTLIADGNPVAFVCTELILRAELILGDLDLLAPVLQADEQARAVLDSAA